MASFQGPEAPGIPFEYNLQDLKCSISFERSAGTFMVGAGEPYLCC